MPLSRFHGTLKAKLEEEIAKVSGQISQGQTRDYESYRESVGYIRGMIAAIKLAEDTEVEMGE